MFNTFIAQLDELAQNHTHDNFLQVQRLQCAILDAHNAGTITHPQYKALYSLMGLVRDDMRQTLTAQGILHV